MKKRLLATILSLCLLVGLLSCIGYFAVDAWFIKFFCGFIKGIIAANTDNGDIFIDGASRITGKPLSEMAAFFYMLEKIGDTMGINFVIACSAKREDLPPFIAKYLQ